MARRLLLVTVLLVAMLGAAACAGDGATDDPVLPGTDLPTLDGATLLQERCTACHELDRVTAATKTFAEWVATIDAMIGKGAKLTPEEQTILADYLSKQ